LSANRRRLVCPALFPRDHRGRNIVDIPGKNKNNDIEDERLHFLYFGSGIVIIPLAMIGLVTHRE